MSRDDSEIKPITSEHHSYSRLAKTLTRNSICSDAALPSNLSKLKETLDSHPEFDLNSRTDSSKPPLYYALMNSNYEAAALLIKRGARCDILTPKELHQVHERIGDDLRAITKKSSESLPQEESQALTKARNAVFATMSVAMGSVLKAMSDKGLLRDKLVTPSSPVSVASSISVSPSSPRSGAGSPPRL